MGKYYSKETDWHTYCQMTKIVLMSNRCDVLYSRENNPRIGGVKYLTSSRILFQGGLGQEPFSPPKVLATLCDTFLVIKEKALHLYNKIF